MVVLRLTPSGSRGVYQGVGVISVPEQEADVEQIKDGAERPHDSDEQTLFIDPEQKGRRQRADPLGNGDQQGLPLAAFAGDEQADEQHGHEQVLEEGRVARRPMAAEFIKEDELQHE